VIGTYNSFSNFDVFAITKELNEILSNGTIANVYEIKDIIILKIQTKNLGKKNLIIKKDQRINLTNYDYPIPKYPSQYITSLRKFLKNRRILTVKQYKFDRIVILDLYNFENENKPWQFIIELFNKGNFLLLDGDNILKVARKYKRFKDRELLPNREYSFPVSRGLDFLTITFEEFKKVVMENSDSEIVRVLARNISIAGLYSEEICYRASIDKKTSGKDLKDLEIEDLFKALKNIRNELLFGEVSAQIVLDHNGNELIVIPISINMLKDYEKKTFNSFNNAVDQFFSKIDSESIKTPYDKKINDQIKSLEKILQNQYDYIEELERKQQFYYEKGNFIYSNFNSLEKLSQVILDAKTKGYSWEEINGKLIKAKQENLEGSEFFAKIIPVSKQLVININDDEVYLDLNKSIGENANSIYAKGKKAKKKIKGTIPAIEQTKKKIEKLNIERESMDKQIDYLIKKPKKKWYEKFLWFESSDGFLVIGGRDATSNEIIFKKYIEPPDLVFHTNFPGSPLTVMKNPENKPISDATLQEVANFVASFSRAWKETWGSVDVFYVSSEQVSKSPPSGEYLPKGSFMIAGKKNIIKNAKTELAIGLKLIKIDAESDENINTLYPMIIYGPKETIKKQVNDYIVLKPSKTGLSKGKLAKEIKSYYIKTASSELKKWINLLTIEEILLCIPTGNSEFGQ